MTIVRRIKKHRGLTTEYQYVEVTENAEIVKENSKTVWVRLYNGDIIKRKRKDVIFREDEK